MSSLFDLISLNKGEEDRQKVLENVSSNVSFRGSNLWILACAIVIASIGLNVNSTAVIIGAMLISPLMGPIVGAGFGLGIFDFDLLRKSLKNLATATLVSLTVATVYFFLSPFKETQSELLARTSPNIYDILIAFFGGLVGVIALTRVEKGNPIPGVAIATALMPPLCTAGYGLAVGNFRFFLGALYLYTINCVFICIATFLIVKYLKYPIKQQVNDRHARQVRFSMTFLITVMLVPGIYFAYQLYQERKFDEKVNRFLQNEFSEKGYTLIYRKTSYNANPKRIELALLAKRFSHKEAKLLQEKLGVYGILNTRLRIRQDTTDLKRDILNEIGAAKAKENEKDIIIANLRKQLDAGKIDNVQILDEAKVLFPGIRNLSIARHEFNSSTDSVFSIPVILYRSEKSLLPRDSEKLGAWLQHKLRARQIELVEQIEPATKKKK
ncbi:DUF389 domain-containing protein [Flavobacterium sp. MAH-1]|uniref:DUF389 domain-containing protein n=1 Tax=Flavobacterium agri TaxID=2743471 RepID=A0A7Y8Y0U3_9FLAO|nr:DUF389 domain-containing protein [Flavobacterium agri]NUY80499.1 DUF389 domain-containing protein [Flavobacterium agri]NYA70524.1 DUF389 domain-containing protein [Flavobacterium agri]